MKAGETVLEEKEFSRMASARNFTVTLQLFLNLLQCLGLSRTVLELKYEVCRGCRSATSEGVLPGEVFISP